MVFFFVRDDSPETAEPATNGQDENGSDQGENGGEENDGEQGGDSGGATEDVESLKSGVMEAVASSQALEGDFDAAIAAGCGDSLEAFNQNVVGLVTRLGTSQEAALALGAELQTVDPSNVSQEDQDIVGAEFEKLSALTLSLDQKHAQLAELSNSCNAAQAE